ncbi:MAG: hypothetical protein AB7N76_27160 [Planctomycetota bacterium]
MNPTRRDQRGDEGERGGGLVLVMIVLVVVAFLVEAVLSASHAGARSTRGTVAGTGGYYAAQAGVWAAANDLGSASSGQGNVSGQVQDTGYARDTGLGDSLNELTGEAGGDGWPDMTPDASFASRPTGSFEARAVDIGGGTRYRVLAKGTADGEVRVLEAVLERVAGTNTPFRRGLFSERGIFVASNPTIDSFSSSKGTYLSQYDNTTKHAGEKGTVASNGNIALGSNVQIWGDARPGPSKNISFGSGSFASGDTSPLSATVNNAAPTWTVPAATDPGVDTSYGYGGQLEIDKPQTVTLGPGKYVFSTVELDDINAKLELTGTAKDTIEIYITGGTKSFEDPSLWLKKGNILITAGGAPSEGLPTVKVMNAGKLETLAGSGVNYTGWAPGGTEGAPALFQYFSTYQSDPWDFSDEGVRFASSGAFSGVVYAPDSLIRFSSNGHIFGAIVGRATIVSSNTKIHYDEDLIGLSAGGATPEYSFSVTMLRELR